MTLSPGQYVTLDVLTYAAGNDYELIEQRQTVKVLNVYHGLGPNGSDAFTAAIKDGVAPGCDFLGHFTEEQIVR